MPHDADPLDDGQGELFVDDGEQGPTPDMHQEFFEARLRYGPRGLEDIHDGYGRL